MNIAPRISDEVPKRFALSKIIGISTKTVYYSYGYLVKFKNTDTCAIIPSEYPKLEFFDDSYPKYEREIG